MPQVVGTELRVLKAVAQLKGAEPIIIGRKVGISSHYAEYLGNYLVRYGYLTSSGRKFILTPEGRWLLEQRAEGERAARWAGGMTMGEMPKLDDNELAVLKAITTLAGKGSIVKVARQAKLSVTMTIDVRDYLIRKGYLEEIGGNYHSRAGLLLQSGAEYRITPEGERAVREAEE